MIKSAEKPRKRDNTISYIRDNSLVLSIDKNEKIIKFNDKFEQVSGYDKKDALERNVFDFLISSRYVKQWKDTLLSLRKNKFIEDFCLPILTRNGHEIMVSWSSFPIKTAGNVVDDIDFVGTLAVDWNDSEAPVIKSVGSKVETKVDLGFDDTNQAIMRLLKTNEELEKKNQKLENRIDALKSRRGKKNVHNSYSGKLVYSLADIAGGKKRRQEFERMMKELDEREKQLNKIETRILNDKKTINDTKNEFTEWRIKLETLENEIFNRNKDLEERAKLLDSTIELGKSIGMTSVGLNEDMTSSGEVDIAGNGSVGVLDEISDCAVVIQRGILKDVNNPFADLIGYKVDEIVDKSFFDFIAPEGIFGIEKYYLNRLKGEKISVYKTVFLCSNDQTVTAEVNIKPTTFNGEKAEVAVFSKLGDAQSISKTTSVINSKPEKEVFEPEVEEPGKEEVAKEKPENSSNHGDKLNEDQISNLFTRARGEEVEEKPEPVVQGGVPNVVTQDQISDMVKRAKAEIEPDLSSDKDAVESEDASSDSSVTGSIKETLKKIQAEKEDDVSTEDTPVQVDSESEKPSTEEKPEETASREAPSSGGTMGQDQISEMMEKARAKKEKDK